jgi:putative DNA primase/helicase
VVERWMRQWPGLPVIVAIHINPETGIKGLVEGKSFGTSDDPTQTDMVSLRRWIWERQGGDVGWANIYFHPNSLIKPINKKASKTDVKALTTLHVDVDCRAGEDQEQGIARIVSLLKKLRGKEGTILTPSDIITSGGGAQAYWRMEAPVPINGNEDVIADLQRYNVHIKMELEGDDCQSLDHIMRMPGTVNIPDEKKRAKGRKPRLATWEYHDATARFSLGMFHKAAPEDTAGVARANAKDWDVKWSHEPIAEDDQRLNGLTSAWKLLGLKGDTKGEYKGLDGKTDRSGMAFAFVTACMRCSPPVSDEAIAQILMDVGWEVGSCIRDKGATVKRHLNRIIERAHKFVAEDIEKPLLVNTKMWDETADRFLQRCFPQGIVYWRDNFYPYIKGVYPVASEDTIMAMIYERLCDAVENVAMKVKDDKGKTVKGAGGEPEVEWKTQKYHPNKNDCGEMLFAIKQKCKLADDVEQPCFLYDGDEYPPARECLNLRNGFLHVHTRKLYEHTPALFTSNISTFDFNQEAKCPVWRSTLAQYWPEAGALEPQLLKEMFGYSLTPWTSLQKLLAVVGPGRSGKGTIGKVLTLLVGKANIAAPTFHSLAADFGRMALINKLLAIVGEAAFGARDDKAEITNFLKTVSGEDPVNIQRKYLDDWEGRLMVRFWLFCNQIPDFLDAGKALMARIVPLKMTRSFAGQEDEKLADKLEAEIAGILNWALEGYQALHASGGKFTMPQASIETKELFGSMASPISGFLEDYCDLWKVEEPLDKDCWASRDDVYLAYHNWCVDVGAHALRLSKAMEAILSLEPARLRMIKKAEDGNLAKRFWAITGLKLKEKPVRRDGSSQGYGARQGRYGGAERGTGASSELSREQGGIPF